MGSAKNPHYKKVHRVLTEYPALLVAEQNEKELEREGLGTMLPSMVASYEETIRGSGISKPTETWALRRVEKSMKLRQIERAMSTLNELERRFVEMRYFGNSLMLDSEIYEEMGLNRKTFYQKVKEPALRKLYIALENWM